jgi:hypothetical protein
MEQKIWQEPLPRYKGIAQDDIREKSDRGKRKD